MASVDVIDVMRGYSVCKCWIFFYFSEKAYFSDENSCHIVEEVVY